MTPYSHHLPSFKQAARKVDYAERLRRGALVGGGGGALAGGLYGALLGGMRPSHEPQDDWQRVLVSGLLGAGAGGLIGGAGGALGNALMGYENEDIITRADKPNYLRRALVGALKGGLAGAPAGALAGAGLDMAEGANGTPGGDKALIGLGLGALLGGGLGAAGGLEMPYLNPDMYEQAE